MSFATVLTKTKQADTRKNTLTHTQRQQSNIDNTNNNNDGKKVKTMNKV